MPETVQKARGIQPQPYYRYFDSSVKPPAHVLGKIFPRSCDHGRQTRKPARIYLPENPAARAHGPCQPRAYQENEKACWDDGARGHVASAQQAAALRQFIED
jgi:hypothetical protein